MLCYVKFYFNIYELSLAILKSLENTIFFNAGDEGFSVVF